MQDDFIPAVPERSKRSSTYSASETAEIRNGLIKKAINVHFNRVTKCPVKTDLSDLPAVKEVAERFIKECLEASILPNYEGLAAQLGISRNYAYEYLRNHPETSTAEYLNNLRLAMASLRMSLAESKVVDNATAIFILKNSEFGLADKIDIQPTEPQNPLKDIAVDAESARRRLIEAIPEDDD